VFQRVHACTILKEGVVTDVVWDEQGSRIFFGDKQGRVAVSYLPKVGVVYIQSICRASWSVCVCVMQKKFKKPDEIIFSDNPVVQMVCCV